MTSTKRTSSVLPLAAALIPFAYLAWRFNFVCDDAFIAFRFSKNLANGLGLRYNVGVEPPVEGYSEFLWVLWLALFEWLRADVTVAPVGYQSQVIPLASEAGFPEDSALFLVKRVDAE